MESDLFFPILKASLLRSILASFSSIWAAEDKGEVDCLCIYTGRGGPEGSWFRLGYESGREGKQVAFTVEKSGQELCLLRNQQTQLFWSLLWGFKNFKSGIRNFKFYFINTEKRFFSFFLSFFFLVLLGAYPQHMEVPRLGVELELQPPAYSHSNARFKPRLWPELQLTATLDP